MGAASIAAMWKQSNTNSSHSRGTAGAHRDGCLGGPREEREKKGVSLKEKLVRMKDGERFWAQIETVKIEAIKER